MGLGCTAFAAPERGRYGFASPRSSRMIIELNVNGRRHRVDVDPDRSLLSVLREELALTGSKYGCGEGQCGACTVLLERRAVRACITPVAKALNAPVTT